MGYPAENNKKYTYKDYLKTPEGVKYQLIEGEMIMTPSPNVAHQEVLFNLGAAIRLFVKSNDFGRVFIAPIDVFLDNYNVVQPDILFINKEREAIITEQNIKGAPDLVVEIISPNSIFRDSVQKKNLYARFGVKEYWLVYPEEKAIEVFQLKGNSFNSTKAFEKKDTLTSPLLTNFELDLAQIW